MPQAQTSPLLHVPGASDHPLSPSKAGCEVGIMTFPRLLRKVERITWLHVVMGYENGKRPCKLGDSPMGHTTKNPLGVYICILLIHQDPRKSFCQLCWTLHGWELPANHRAGPRKISTTPGGLWQPKDYCKSSHPPTESEPLGHNHHFLPSLHWL